MRRAEVRSSYLHDLMVGTMPPIWIDPNDTTRRSTCKVMLMCWHTSDGWRMAALPFHFHPLLSPFYSTLAYSPLPIWHYKGRFIRSDGRRSRQIQTDTERQVQVATKYLESSLLKVHCCLSTHSWFCWMCLENILGWRAYCAAYEGKLKLNLVYLLLPCIFK